MKPGIMYPILSITDRRLKYLGVVTSIKKMAVTQRYILKKYLIRGTKKWDDHDGNPISTNSSISLLGPALWNGPEKIEIKWKPKT